MNNFETIYSENYPRMYSVALNMINDGDAAADIIHDIFLYYHKTSRNGHSIEKPGSWLIRATVNKCIDHSKRQRKHQKIESIQPIPVEVDSDDKNYEKQIIRQALSKLKPKERTLAILYSEGMSYKEISELSGIKLSSVGKMLSRTIKKMNEILKKMNYELY